MSGYHDVAPLTVRIPNVPGNSSINLESPPSRPSPGATQKKEQRRWSHEMDEFLVASLIVELEKRGRRAGKGFLSVTLKAVAMAVSEGCGTIVSSENVRSRVKTLKRDYITMKAALEASGFGISWDDGAKYIIADHEAWDDYVKSHPEAKGLRYKFFPHYDSLAIICGVDNVAGDGMVTGQDPEVLQGTGGGTPLEDDEGENDVEDLGSESPTDDVAMDEDSPATPAHPPSDSGRRGRTPTLLRRDDSPEVLLMNAISNSIASIADTLKGPDLGELVREMKNIPGMSRMMFIRGTALFADKPALVKMYQAMKEEMKLEWLEMMLDKHGY